MNSFAFLGRRSLGEPSPAGAGATGRAVMERRVVTTSDVLAEPDISLPAEVMARHCSR